MQLTPEQWEIVRGALVAVIVALLALLGYDVGIVPLAVRVGGREIPPRVRQAGRLALVGLLLAALLGLGYGIVGVQPR